MVLCMTTTSLASAETNPYARCIDASRKVRWDVESDGLRGRALDTEDVPSVFRREGDVWLVMFDGETAHLRDLKGMQYLARLLAQPRRKIHVLELVGEPGPELPACSL